MNDSSERALAALLYGIESRKGIITLIGAPGPERAAVVDGASEALGERAAVARVDQPIDDFDALLELVCNGFGIAADAPRRLRRLVAINEFLLAQMAYVDVDVAVLQNARLYGRLNEYFAAAMARYPGKFIGLAGVDEVNADSEVELAVSSP